jgi:polyferredoxin
VKSLKRKQLQGYTWLGLPAVIITGFFYPVVGFLLFGCMIGAVGLAFRRGRNWCDWMCPRGAFFDLFFSKISRNIEIPALFRSKALRIFMLGVIFTAMGTQFYFAWGDPGAMGMALVRILTVTTMIGIILALFIHPRTWCHICPMGTVAHWISEGRKPLYISEDCSNCGKCARVCPMQLNPNSYKDEGIMGDNDCIKCGTCVAGCPIKALSLNEKPAKKKQQDAA